MGRSRFDAAPHQQTVPCMTTVPTKVVEASHPWQHSFTALPPPLPPPQPTPLLRPHYVSLLFSEELHVRTAGRPTSYCCLVCLPMLPPPTDIDYPPISSAREGSSSRASQSKFRLYDKLTIIKNSHGNGVREIFV